MLLTNQQTNDTGENITSLAHQELKLGHFKVILSDSFKIFCQHFYASFRIFNRKIILQYASGNNVFLYPCQIYDVKHLKNTLSTL